MSAKEIFAKSMSIFFIHSILVITASFPAHAQEDLLRGVIEGVGRAIIQEDNARKQEEYRRQEARRREAELRRQEAYRQQVERQHQQRILEQQRHRAQSSHQEASSRPSQASRAGRQQRSVYATGESRETISRVQEMLNRLGYPAGPVDGLMGSKTARAIRAFQADQGVRQTGQPSGSLVLSLQSVLQRRATTNQLHRTSMVNEQTSVDSSGLPASALQENSRDQAADESLLLVNVGSWGSLPKEWRDDGDWQERQRQRLAAMVADQTLGTELEQRFVSSQPLTLVEVRQAFTDAGIDASRFERVERLFRNGVKVSPSQQSLGMLTHTVRMNQFEAARLQEALRVKARAAVLREAQAPSATMTLICGLSMESYDFQNGRFPISEQSIERCFSGGGETIKNVRGHRARVIIESPLRPDAIPVSPSMAEEWVNRLGGARFALAVPATVTASVAQDDRGHPLLSYVANPSDALEVRSGRDLSEVLYRYRDEDLSDARYTPETRKLEDFDRPWWLDSDDEVERIVSRAQAIALDELSATDLFGEETGLTFSFRASYGEGLTTGERSLQDFLEERHRGDVFELSQALGLPVENLLVISLPLGGRRHDINQATLVLPRDAQTYDVGQQLPDHNPQDGDHPFAAVEVAVTAEKVVRLPDGKQRLLLAGHPARLVVRRSSSRLAWQEAPKIASVDFKRQALVKHERIDLAWRGELLWQGARLAGQDPEEIIRRQLASSSFARSDAFARREAVETLADGIRARLDDRDRRWVKASIRLAPYDFERQGWPVTGLSPEFSASAPEADRVLNVQLSSGPSGRGFFLAMSPERAREFQEASENYPAFDALLALRVSGVDTRYGRGATLAAGMRLRYEPEEVILFDAGRGQVIINDNSVRLRHVFSKQAESGAEGQALSSRPEDDEHAETPGEFSIKGIRLGEDFASAVDRLADAIDADQRYQASVESRQRVVRETGVEPINDWAAFHNGVLLESTHRHELVAIYHEPPILQDTVTAVSRTKLFPPGKGPSWPLLRQKLIETYPTVDPERLGGIEQQSSIVLTLWSQDTQPSPAAVPLDPKTAACMRGLSARARVSQSQFGLGQKARENGYLRPNDSRAAWFDEQDVMAVSSLASTYSLPGLFGGLDDCPVSEVLVIGATFGDDARILSLRQAIANPVRMAALADERRRQTENEALEVDFDL
ncbi:peptidoglycan-binding protein [Halomonas sp. 1390]|uniref:peptidoglycan-binding domain-containing protein n=1 Tax=Halomonas sp. B23F22_3 TaxID=3459516 RepID=UPI00373FBCE6